MPDLCSLPPRMLNPNYNKNMSNCWILFEKYLVMSLSYWFSWRSSDFDVSCKEMAHITCITWISISLIQQKQNSPLFCTATSRNIPAIAVICSPCWPFSQPCTIHEPFVHKPQIKIVTKKTDHQTKSWKCQKKESKFWSKRAPSLRSLVNA